mmetsp:Transcript_160933/g.516525  ORF Transcript_160933/g.516525 Transcript_160933/m.516525 type:complete len:244 (-) Transcript_160933:12-743(-)
MHEVARQGMSTKRHLLWKIGGASDDVAGSGASSQDVNVAAPRLQRGGGGGHWALRALGPEMEHDLLPLLLELLLVLLLAGFRLLVARLIILFLILLLALRAAAPIRSLLVDDVNVQGAAGHAVDGLGKGVLSVRVGDRGAGSLPGLGIQGRLGLRVQLGLELIGEGPRREQELQAAPLLGRRQHAVAHGLQRELGDEAALGPVRRELHRHCHGVWEDRRQPSTRLGFRALHEGPDLYIKSRAS